MLCMYDIPNQIHIGSSGYMVGMDICVIIIDNDSFISVCIIGTLIVLRVSRLSTSVKESAINRQGPKYD